MPVMMMTRGTETQLDATADVPGTFVYIPAVGVILPGGNNQTLHTDFTPSDATNYSNADKDAHINVLKADQTITMPASYAKTYGDVPFATGATASSGLPLTYTVKTGKVSVATNLITINAAGLDTIVVSQAGDANYNPAPKDSATIVIAKASLTATADNKNRSYNTPNPALTISYHGFVNGDDAGDLDVVPTLTTTATQASVPGVYPITFATQGSDLNYSFVYVSGYMYVNYTTPDITTDTVINITVTSAKTGGVIVPNAFTITQRGVCFDVNPNPTINSAITTDGIGGGHFISTISVLQSNKTYYVRAYAIVSDGAVYYGNERSFTTKTAGISEAETPNYKLYPNPSNGQITIEGEGLTSIEVMDLTGNIILINKLSSQSQIANGIAKTNVDLSNQPKGIYMVRLTSEKTTVIERVVIQ
jgi:hypothetical protein